MPPETAPRLEGWTQTTIGRVARLVTGKTPSTKNPGHFGGGVPFVTPSDFDGSSKVSKAKRSLSPSGLATMPNCLLPPRSVMVYSIGMGMGGVAMTGFDCVTNQQITSLIANDGVSPEYIYYDLSRRRDDLRQRASGGSAQLILTKKGLSQVPITLPPLPQQRAIARVLGSLDDKIELNHRMNQTLEQIAQALFKFWFVDFGPVRAKAEGRWKKGESQTGMPADMWDLWPNGFDDSEIGEIPKGWEIRPLGEVASFTRGISYRGEDLAASDTALVNLKCAGRGGAYREDGLKAYRGPFKEGQVVRAGDVVVSHTDVTQRAEVIGRAYVVRPSSRFVRLVASLDMAIVRPTSGGQTREYLAYALSDERFRDHAYGYTNGTTVLHLSSQALTDYPHLMPPAEVVRRFSEAVSPDHELIAEHSLESDTLMRTRDALLPKLLSGEIRVPVGGGA